MEQKPNYGPTPSRRVRKVDMNPLRVPAIAASWGTAIVLVTPLCGLWFSCGCDWPWVNFFFVCNAIVNTPIPHCPWCVDSLTAATCLDNRDMRRLVRKETRPMSGDMSPRGEISPPLSRGLLR